MKTEPEKSYSYYEPHCGYGDFNGHWVLVTSIDHIPKKLRESGNYRTHYEQDN